MNGHETLTVRTDDGEKQLTRREITAKVNEMTREFRRKETADNAASPYPAEPDECRTIMLRYPRLVAHLICQSLGYFCPRSAARAIAHYKDAKPFFCEWYCSGSGFNDQKVVEIGRDTLKRAVANRHSHTGYMAEYISGRVVIIRELNGNGPVLASWF